jgi:SAM-dependent methyltransferase
MSVKDKLENDTLKADDFRDLYKVVPDPWKHLTDENIDFQRGYLSNVLDFVMPKNDQRTWGGVLDVGCGVGGSAVAILGSDELAIRVMRYVGVDISPEACATFLKAAREVRILPVVEFGAYPLRAEVVLPTMPDRNFKLGLLSEVLYYNTEEIWTAIMHESLRVCEFVCLVEKARATRRSNVLAQIGQEVHVVKADIWYEDYHHVISARIYTSR